MSPPKRIAGFVCGVLLVFGLLVWVPWPGLRGVYARFYRAGANSVFRSEGPELKIWFRPPRYEHGAGKDVELVTRKGGSEWVRSTPIDSRLSGYLPTAQVVALVLATPIPWSRRWRALLWGLVLVNVFTALRVGVTVLYSLTHPPPFISGLNPIWGDIVDGAYEIAVRTPTTSFVVPIFIWILVSLRHGDWAKERGHH